MITCEAAREMLLEGDPAELRREGDGELAAHLRACPDCRQRAAFILGETRALENALDAVRPVAAGATRRRRLGTIVRRWHVLAPLALAAGLGALILARRHSPSLTGTTPLRIAAAVQPPLDVQVSGGQSVAVFQTDNPNIVVIWSY